MTNSRWRGNPGPGAGAAGLLADRELDLSLENVEGVGVILVDVRLDGAEARLAPELEHLELTALVLDAELAPLAGKQLALAEA